MDATPIDLAAGGLASLTFAHDPAWADDSITAQRWAALHDAAAVVAALAGLPAEAPSPRVRAFPAAVGRAPAVRREMAQQWVDDIRAMMEPGLAALLAVRSRGGDTAAPATALCEEFRRARDAVLAMIEPTAR